MYSQSCRIVATSYKQINKTNGEWGDWPSYWTSYKSEGRSNPVIKITTISEGSDGDFYNLKMYIDDKVQADFNVKYDPDKSSKMRKEWDDDYVNCYREMNGSDYVFTEKVSLKSLVEDNDAWASNEDAKLYLMVYSQNMAVVVK